MDDYNTNAILMPKWAERVAVAHSTIPQSILGSVGFSIGLEWFVWSTPVLVYTAKLIEVHNATLDCGAMIRVTAPSGERTCCLCFRPKEMCMPFSIIYKIPSEQIQTDKQFHQRLCHIATMMDSAHCMYIPSAVSAHQFRQPPAKNYTVDNQICISFSASSVSVYTLQSNRCPDNKTQRIYSSRWRMRAEEEHCQCRENTWKALAMAITSFFFLVGRGSP